MLPSEIRYKFGSKALHTQNICFDLVSKGPTNIRFNGTSVIYPYWYKARRISNTNRQSDTLDGGWSTSFARTECIWSSYGNGNKTLTTVIFGNNVEFIGRNMIIWKCLLRMPEPKWEFLKIPNVCNFRWKKVQWHRPVRTLHKIHWFSNVRHSFDRMLFIEEGLLATRSIPSR